jgi:uncharacterized protein (DUF885 family)
MKRMAAPLLALLVTFSATAGETLWRAAGEYYLWRLANFPVAASDQGDHTWDDRLTDYSAAAIAKRRAHVVAVLTRVKAMDGAKWPKEEAIDRILFRSQLESAEFTDRVLQPESTNPQTYVDEASNAIFSLLKKEYDAPHTRALAATARMRAMPKMLEQGKQNLTRPVRLYAQLAIESARSIDPLFNDSLDPLAKSLTGDERRSFDEARTAAIRSAHAFADWLEKKLPSMQPWKAMGEADYNFMLHRLLLLPMNAHDVAHLGEVELARYRALEAMLPDPSLADPDPKRAASIPADQQAFLAAYQSREAEMIQFLREKHLVTLPPYLGRFLIKQLPEAFKPTSPGGFMNPPGLEETDNSGFYFIPDVQPEQPQLLHSRGDRGPAPHPRA